MDRFKELPVKGAVFDFDGTLVDSMYMWKDIDREYLSRHGHEMTPDLQVEIEGMSQDEMCEYFRTRYRIRQSNEEMQKEWFDMARCKYLHEVQLKPGMKNLLSYFRERGIRIAVATSFVKAIVEPCLERLGVLDFFESIVTTDEAGVGKGSPEVFVKAAAAIGVSPAECVAFEDLPIGLLSAKKAGMYTVAVYDRYSEGREEMKKESADFFIVSADELLS